MSVRRVVQITPMFQIRRRVNLQLHCINSMNSMLLAAKYCLNLGKLVMKVFGRTKTTRFFLLIP